MRHYSWLTTEEGKKHAYCSDKCLEDQVIKERRTTKTASKQKTVVLNPKQQGECEKKQTILSISFILFSYFISLNFSSPSVIS